MSGVFQSGQLVGSVHAEDQLSATVSKPRSVGGTYFTTDEKTLTLKDGVLSVNTAKEVEKGNDLPVTADAVHQEFEIVAALFETN